MLPMTTPTFSLDELCTLTGLQKRTVRFYIQSGLVPRPEGEKRGAYYLPIHLDTLLRIKTLTEAGISLERIREVLAGEPPAVPPRARTLGSVSVRSHVLIAPGLELQICPDEANVSPEQIREFARLVSNQWNLLKDQSDE
ncbi:helix-turn-helix domain-containing protein [Limnobacter sp.]|uniref:helix-turn-helix domain-containing protein n=1 Tax=Limnobacter sp. TaxID=2003368 RepID=UPI00338E7AC8